MHVLYGGMGLIGLVLWVYYLVDVLSADEAECRILPKAVWVCVVLLVPGLGSLLWVLAGRPMRSARLGARRNDGGPGHSAHRERPAPSAPRDPAADEVEFQRRFRERVEEQRRAARRRREDEDQG